MRTGLLRRILVVTLAAALTGVFSLSSAWSAGDASWAGRVIDADGVTPRTGVVVSLVDHSGDLAASSAPTRTDGAFVIDAAPAGEYAVLIESDEGAFLAGRTLQLRPGRNDPAALHLAPGVAHGDLDYGFGSGQKGLKPWLKWTLASVIGVAAIVAILEIGDDASETAASPF